MTSNPKTRQIRWLMLAVMASDLALTLAGQPHSYWHNPSAAQDLNRLLAWGMRMGPAIAIFGYLPYMAAAFALATYLPGRLASIAALTFVLGHFAAASGWVVYRFHLGLSGLYAFSFVVSAALAALTKEPCETTPIHDSGETESKRSG